MSLLVGSRRALLNRRPSIVFLDEFINSPISTDRWTVTDTGGNLSVTGGALAVAGGVTEGDPGIASKRVFTRRAGLTLEFAIRTTSNTSSTNGVGFATTATPTVNMPGQWPAGFRLTSATGFTILDNEATAGPSARVIVADTDYLLRIVLKAAGALYYVSGGIYGTLGLTWTLVWESSVNATAALYVTMASKNMVWALPSITVRQSGVKPPVAEDTFTRADSALTLGSAETGQAWTPVSGTWGISSNRAYNVSDTSGQIATIPGGAADGIVDCTLRGDMTGAAYSIPQVIARYNDANNFLYAQLYNGNAALVKVDGGALSSLASAVTPTVDSTDYALRLVMVGNSVRVYKDNTEVISHTLSGGDTKYAAYTTLGFRFEKSGSPTADARWDSFRFQAA